MTEESYTDDSADVSQLEQRIDELEETIRQMLPSRREAIGMGVAGLAGASLMSGTASAGSAQVGTIGDASNLVDLVAEDVTITDTLNTASLSGAAAGEALTSDGSGGLSFAEVAGGVPSNFSYDDVTNSRSLNTTFTNNTGKALFVLVHIENDTNATLFGYLAEVNGKKIMRDAGRLSGATYDSASNEFTASFFVPDGGTYKILPIGSIVIVNWHEAEM